MRLMKKIYLPLGLVVLLVLQPAPEWRERLCQVCMSAVMDISLLQENLLVLCLGVTVSEELNQKEDIPAS